MRSELHLGAKLFNEGQWWEAHEAWEPHWLKATGVERHYIQGLILLAAALHKRWVHGNLKARNFDKAQRHLAQVPPHHDALDLSALQMDVWHALETEGYYPQICLE